MPHNIYASARGAMMGDQIIPHWNQLPQQFQQILAIVIQHAMAMGMASGAAQPNALISNIMAAFDMPPSNTVALEQILAAAKAKFTPVVEEAKDPTVEPEETKDPTEGVAALPLAESAVEPTAVAALPIAEKITPTVDPTAEQNPT